MTSSTPKPLRVVVTGATGNVGTSVMRRLAEEPRVVSALGLARRTPRLSYPGVEWAACDLTAPEAPDQLLRLFEGADAVVHLAWRFQPTRDAAVTWEANVLGSLRVFEAAATVGVPALVHASSVGAYAPGPADGHRVDESWPTHGWPGAAYTREKAYLERVLDTFERDHPDTRVVRMRPAFLFKESAAGEQLRIFGHRLLPGRLLRPDLLPVLPGVRGLRFQALHTDDAADAYARAVVQEVRGPFNLAADPVIDGQVLAALLESRSVELPRRCRGRRCRRGGGCGRWGPHRGSSTRCYGCRSWTPRGPVRSWAGRRSTARPRRWTPSCAGCARTGACRPRRSPGTSRPPPERGGTPPGRLPVGTEGAARRVSGGQLSCGWSLSSTSFSWSPGASPTFSSRKASARVAQRRSTAP